MEEQRCSKSTIVWPWPKGFGDWPEEGLCMLCIMYVGGEQNERVDEVNKKFKSMIWLMMGIN